jgi:hypothetical protein
VERIVRDLLGRRSGHKIKSIELPHQSKSITVPKN